MDLSFFHRKLNSGDMLDYTVECCRQNGKTLLLMTLAFHVPVIFVLTYLMDIGNLFDDFLKTAVDPDPQVLLRTVLPIYVGVFLFSVYQSVFFHILTLGVVRNTYELVVYDRSLSAKESLRCGLKKFGWMVVYQILLSTILGVALYAGIFIVSLISIPLIAVVGYMGTAGIVLFVIFLIVVLAVVLLAIAYILTKLTFVPQAIVIENADVMKAIKLSFKVSRKRLWRVLWPCLFGMLFIQFFPEMVSSLSIFVPFSDPLVNRIVSALVEAGIALTTPFYYVLTTLVYIHFQTESGTIAFLERLKRLVKDEKKTIQFYGKPENTL